MKKHFEALAASCGVSVEQFTAAHAKIRDKLHAPLAVVLEKHYPNQPIKQKAVLSMVVLTQAMEALPGMMRNPKAGEFAAQSLMGNMAQVIASFAPKAEFDAMLSATEAVIVEVGKQGDLLADSPFDDLKTKTEN